MPLVGCATFSSGSSYLCTKNQTRADPSWRSKDLFQSVNRGWSFMVGTWTFTWSSPESWRSSARKARNSSSSSCVAIVHTSPNICNPPTTKNFTRNPPPKKMRVDRMHEFHALAGIPQCRRISRIGKTGSSGWVWVAVPPSSPLSTCSGCSISFLSSCLELCGDTSSIASFQTTHRHLDAIVKACK